MSQAYSGVSGSGSVVVYTTPRDGEFRLELVTFTLTCDATAGIHSALVTLTDPAAMKATARLWDQNEGGPSMTLYYTFGIGLIPSACTVTTGQMLAHDLPKTLLYPQTAVTVTAVNGAGATIAGDTITAVVLYGEFLAASPDETVAQKVFLLPGLLPGSVAA